MVNKIGIYKEKGERRKKNNGMILYLVVDENSNLLPYDITQYEPNPVSRSIFPYCVIYIKNILADFDNHFLEIWTISYYSPMRI